MLKPYAIDNNNTKFYTNTIQTTLFNTQFLIRYSIVNYTNKKTYQENKHKFYGETQPEKHFIQLRLGLINNNPNHDILSILQHELTHIYQYSERNNNTLLSKKYKPLYDKAFDNINNYQENNKDNTPNSTYNFYLAYALYISFNCETQAYLHGFEAEIKDSALHWPSTINETDLYSKLIFLRYIIKNYDKLKHLVKPLFNINQNLYLKILTNAEKKIIKGIGRVLKLNINEKINCLGKTIFTEPYFVKIPTQPWIL